MQGGGGPEHPYNLTYIFKKASRSTRTHRENTSQTESKRRRQEPHRTVEHEPVSKKWPSKQTHLFCTEQQQQQQRTDWKVLSEKEIIVNVRKAPAHDSVQGKLAVLRTRAGNHECSEAWEHHDIFCSKKNQKTVTKKKSSWHSGQCGFPSQTPLSGLVFAFPLRDRYMVSAHPICSCCG